MRVKLGSPEHRARIIRNFTRARDDMKQIFVNVAHWNRTHPDETPIDIDLDGRMARCIASIDFMLKCEEAAKGVGPIEPVELINRTREEKRTRQ